MPDPARIQPRPKNYWIQLAVSRGGNIADLGLQRAGLDGNRVEQWIPTSWPAWAATTTTPPGEGRTLPEALVEKLRSLGHNPRQVQRRDPDLDRPANEVRHLKRVARQRGADFDGRSY